METLVDKLLEHGVVGLFAAVFLVLYLRKDAELSAERKARIADSKDGYGVLMGIQERALTTADKMADMYNAAIKSLQQGGGKGGAE
jgi:hypothetical protein